MSDLVNRIEKRIKEKGTNFKRVEQELGLGNGTIKRWSTQSPRLDKLVPVAEYLQVSLDYLVFGSSVSETSTNGDRPDLEARRSARASPVTASRCPRMRWISSPCTGSFRRPIGRRSSTWSTSSTSATSRRKKNLFTRHISTGARTKKAAPLGAVRPATEPPNFFVLP